ncbi:hypothetical protein HUT16_02405 [Kitasatospora sp. NA04385]|uniref:hypothetical protein n=1 Tax=Kitasatospora sp. NA04385 TaxID=2742135 RepID=UPI001591A8B5|nr:hypothetical protein [Kitasatospora sp. NA04385]QKW18066.1 hypothetical protein HUT16_02405 [Kitasatospora sp. NA04385]
MIEEAALADAAAALAIRLTEATGSETRILRTPRGGYRLETVSSDFDPAVVDAVLSALATADRYGHSYRRQCHTLWAELHPKRSDVPLRR